jgi:hypothetical protein
MLGCWRAALLTAALSMADAVDADEGNWLRPLTEAAQASNVEEVQRLLAQDEAPQAIVADTKGVAMCRVMMSAIRFASGHEAESEQIVELMLAHGADIDARPDGNWTPLHLAAYFNNRAMVALLLAHHADFTVPDKNGFPPPRRALSEDVLNLFLQAGAPPESFPSAQRAQDAAACEEVVRARRWQEIRAQDDGLALAPQDPRENWTFQREVLEQDIVSGRIQIQKRDYVLAVWAGKPHWVFIDDTPPDAGPMSDEAAARVHYGMTHPKRRKGPVYLARIGPDGVVGLVCEFKSRPNSFFAGIHVMTPLERLKSLADKEDITLSKAAIKVPGLWGGQVIVALGQKTRGGFKAIAPGALSDALDAHRDDLVRLYEDNDLVEEP